jgi:hypothetical protein
MADAGMLQCVQEILEQGSATGIKMNACLLSASSANV